MRRHYRATFSFAKGKRATLSSLHIASRSSTAMASFVCRLAAPASPVWEVRSGLRPFRVMPALVCNGGVRWRKGLTWRSGAQALGAPVPASRQSRRERLPVMSAVRLRGAPAQTASKKVRRREARFARLAGGAWRGDRPAPHAAPRPLTLPALRATGGRTSRTRFDRFSPPRLILYSTFFLFSSK